MITTSDYIITDNELYHYGVKGMKWGVRRYQNKDGSLTREGKNRHDEENKSKRTILTRRNVAIGASVVGTALVVMGGMYIYKKSNAPVHVKTLSFGKKIPLDSLPSDDTVLPKGTKFHRISSKSVEQYVEDGRSAYVSFMNKDNRIYKEAMPDYIKQWGKEGIISDDGKKAYEHVLKTKGDIRVASRRTVAEIYLKVTGESDVDSGRYTRFMESLVDRNNDNVKSFLNTLKERGYNAIVDENDAGNFTTSPLILLDPKNDIESVKSHRIRSMERVINTLLR